MWTNNADIPVSVDNGQAPAVYNNRADINNYRPANDRGGRGGGRGGQRG